MAISRPRNSESFADSIPPCFSGEIWQVFGQNSVCRERALAQKGCRRRSLARHSLAPLVSQGPRSKQHASLPRTGAIQRPPSSSFEHFSMTRWVLTYCVALSGYADSDPSNSRRSQHLSTHTVGETRVCRPSPRQFEWRAGPCTYQLSI